MSSAEKNTGVLTAGLALFSMFFGAGNLIWPLFVGSVFGDSHVYAFLGLLITGVSLPFLGVIAMMLFDGHIKNFFARIGKIPSFIVILLIQAILGPFGAVPRIIALSFATLKPYLPASITLFTFSLFFSAAVFFFTMRKNRMLGLLGAILTPALLISLAVLFMKGLIHTPTAPPSSLAASNAFTDGLKVGYNTLDLMAAFLFAPLALAHFQAAPLDRKKTFQKMLQASGIAALLLGAIYLGLVYLSAHYSQLCPSCQPEERLREIAQLLLGQKGAMLASFAIVLACLTTAIPLTAISAEYIREDLCKNKISFLKALVLSIVIATGIANLGFMGIASLLAPILQILYPGLIVLSVLNILHKLYEIKMAKAPVYAAFAISTISYAAML